MQTYWTKTYELLKRRIFEPDNIENEGLFGLDNYFLSVKNKLLNVAENMEQRLDSFIEKMFVRKNGVKFLQNHPSPEVLARNPELSHDQITFVCAFSVATKKNYHIEVWNQIRFSKYWFKYDERYLHPRDVLYYAACRYPGKVRNICCALLIPFMVFTFIRKYTERTDGSKTIKTSEARMYFTRTEGIGVEWFTKLYHKILSLTHFKDVKGVMKAYYIEIEHPNLNFKVYQ